MEKRLNLIWKIALVLVLVGGAWVYGVLSHRDQLFPYPQLKPLANAIRQTADTALGQRPWWYASRPGQIDKTAQHDPSAVAPGLTLISGVSADDHLMARIVDVDGQEVHSWPLDWFEIWPDPSHLREDEIPKRKPGTQPHGIVLADNGDLIVSFEYLGLVRMNACGAVTWRLPRRTHHALHWDPKTQTFWTIGMTKHRGKVARLPNHDGFFIEHSLLEVSPDGEVLTEFSISDLLIDNGLHGLLYLSTLHEWETEVTDDTLHVNDVEIFPETLEPGVFEPGDILISLRNINAVMVLDRSTLTIKYLSVGKFLRQHDPDFIDGNTLSVFDNNNLRPLVSGVHSKIVKLDATDGSVSSLFSGTDDLPFFTDIMGKHQVLENGNMLLLESRSGRALEVTADGRPVWEYFNVVEPGLLGVLVEAQRLPVRFDAAFFAEKVADCADVDS